MALLDGRSTARSVVGGMQWERYMRMMDYLHRNEKKLSLELDRVLPGSGASVCHFSGLATIGKMKRLPDISTLVMGWVIILSLTALAIGLFRDNLGQSEKLWVLGGGLLLCYLGSMGFREVCNLRTMFNKSKLDTGSVFLIDFADNVAGIEILVDDMEYANKDDVQDILNKYHKFRAKIVKQHEMFDAKFN